jgi:hypothetical protein
MQSVIYAECRKQAHYAECHYAECYYAECHYAECHYDEFCGALPLDIVLPASVHAKRISHLSAFPSLLGPSIYLRHINKLLYRKLMKSLNCSL